MFSLRPIALVGGTVVCSVGFLLFIPLIVEIFYNTDTWQSYAVPILIYLIVVPWLLQIKILILKYQLKRHLLLLYYLGFFYLFYVQFIYLYLNQIKCY